jgi:succinate dehydrogenase / fumarate reductase iron-sulfur subunit
MPNARRTVAVLPDRDRNVSQRLTLRIRRTGRWVDFAVDMCDGAYVLDALEAAARLDATLLFRHSCHHASCGACGLLLDGREALACVTRISDVARPGRPLTLEPLRNLPRLGDLLVDLQPLLAGIQEYDLPAIRAAGSEDTPGAPRRFENCIECGLCLSACPIVGSDPSYAGPAALAAAARVVAEPRGRDAGRVLHLVDGEQGVWRCHSAFECTEVCPAGVNPAQGIMDLRWRLMRTA